MLPTVLLELWQCHWYLCCTSQPMFHHYDHLWKIRYFSRSPSPKTPLKMLAHVHAVLLVSWQTAVHCMCRSSFNILRICPSEIPIVLAKICAHFPVCEVHFLHFIHMFSSCACWTSQAFGIFSGGYMTYWTRVYIQNELKKPCKMLHSFHFVLCKFTSNILKVSVVFFSRV